MAKRSLQASVEGIRKARQAFKRKGWTQEYLAAEVGLETRQPIWKFFSGKPVDRQVFHEICFVLELESEEIRLKPEVELQKSVPQNSGRNPKQTGSGIGINLVGNNSHSNGISLVNSSGNNLDEQVQKVRAALLDKIQHQCGCLRLLDVSRPLNLDELYVDVNIIEEVSSHRWLSLASLQPEDSQGWERLKIKESGRLTTSNRDRRLSGIDAVGNHPRLMVLGKPGAGKTTFLQAIALKCNHGGFKGDCVPIFISLKRFSEAVTPLSLLEFISREFSDCGLSADDWHYLFTCGRGLILLDGLDEVHETAYNWVVREIRNFSDRYYKTQIIVSCRVAAQLYQFPDFTAVEIADLTPSQISKFAQRWFYVVGNMTASEASDTAQKFMQKLELPENYAIRELATTPILLNLMCLVFNSLGDFPKDRAQLYKQGLDLLLVRWDETRGIKRSEASASVATTSEMTYQNLSLQDKIKILSRIAAATFTNGDYFFSENNIKHAIGEAIQEIQGSPIDASTLELNCQAIIKSIESQHGLLLEQARGIYSFSHLTFQEYFTAWEIALNSDKKTLQEVSAYVWESRWREVFLLMAGILPVADELLALIQEKIVDLRDRSPQLCKYLQWIDAKAQSLQRIYNPVAVKAFYFTLNLPSFHPLAGNQSFALVLEPAFAVNLGAEIELDLNLRQAVTLSQTITPEIFSQRIRTLRMSLDNKKLAQINPELHQLIQELLAQLPSEKGERANLKTWWQTHGLTWTNQLRSYVFEYRQIGYDWKVHGNESEYIQKYWQICQLIHDCLKCAAYVSPERHRQVMDSLFAYR